MNVSKEEGEYKTPVAAPSPQTPLLTMVENMLHNIIKQKKEGIHKTQNIQNTNRIWRRIQTLRWVLAQILTLLRQITTTITTCSIIS
jgi:hypothetical protein